MSTVRSSSSLPPALEVLHHAIAKEIASLSVVMFGLLGVLFKAAFTSD